jgi:hypothetical protein
MWQRAKGTESPPLLSVAMARVSLVWLQWMGPRGNDGRIVNVHVARGLVAHSVGVG